MPMLRRFYKERGECMFLYEVVRILVVISIDGVTSHLICVS